VFVATGTNFPDALSAAAAAAKLGGPLLLTAPNALPKDVAAEIQRLRPAKIVVVGGSAVVSDAVKNSLAALVKPWSGQVTRAAGADRYETGRRVVGQVFSGGAPSVFIATGRNYPDALSASAAAGARGMPVVLVNGTASGLDTATKNLLTSLGTTSFHIAGGTRAVSAGIAADLAKLGSVTRYAGTDRYDTSQKVNKAYFSKPSSAYFATGSGFPDALSGSALAASENAPLFVVAPTCVPASIRQDLATAATPKVTLVGGLDVLSNDVAKLSSC